MAVVVALLVTVAAATRASVVLGATTIAISTTAQLENTLRPTGCSAAISPCAADGDTIVLAPGTYSPTLSLDTVVSFTLEGPSDAPGAVISGASVRPDPDTDSVDILATASGTSVVLRNLTFSDAPLDGVAVNALGTITLENSTLSGNLGTAAWLAGTATVRNTTVSGNAENGVMSDGDVTLVNVTIANNGWMGIANASIGSFTRLTSSIVWGNGLDDCTVPVEADTASLDGDGSCGVGALGGTNPLLGPLAANGGPTSTHAIPQASPAVNAGSNAACPASDQRGSPRNDGSCDIGAYELLDTTPPVITTPGNLTAVAPSPAGVNVTYTVTYASDPDDPVTSSGCSPASGALYPLGVTTVTCTATDTHNNTSTASFTVTVDPQPSAGCRADGKISARGGALHGAATVVLAAGFRDDNCGPVVDATGDTMLVYNVDTDGPSDSGLAGASCRTDAFTGAEAPYTQAALASLNGEPGALGCSQFSSLEPPYQPTPGPFPAPTDQAARIMSFPIGGTSVVIAVNLEAADCGGASGALLLTTSLLSRLLGGDIRMWNSAALRPQVGGSTINSWLQNCNVPVTRVVRFDRSSTTQTVKNYLVNADNARATSTQCFVGGTWSVYASDANNTQWPNDGGGVCSPLTTSGSAGVTSQLSTCAATTGALCYADLPAIPGSPGASLLRAFVRNSTDTSFQAAQSGSSKANCNFGTLSLPTGGSSGAVGLNESANPDNWATDGPAGSRGDVTFEGPAYPICALTFALVYSGLKSSPGALFRLTYNQRQTLYAYFSWVLSSPGLDRMTKSSFQGLPPAPASTLRAGFQANY